MITLNTNPGLLRTAVYERILSDLQQGAIAPGETISLNKLAETLNISKAFCAVNHAEHDRIIELFESGTAEELSRYVTQVHWSFNWQQGTES